MRQRSPKIVCAVPRAPISAAAVISAPVEDQHRKCQRNFRTASESRHHEIPDETRSSDPDWGVRFLQQTRTRLCVCGPSELNEMEQHHGNTSVDHCGNPRHIRHCRDLSPPDPLGCCAYCRGTAGRSRWCEPLHLRPRTARQRAHAESCVDWAHGPVESLGTMLLVCVSETGCCPFRVLPDPLSAHARAVPPRGGTGQSQITARSPFPLRYEELDRPQTMSRAGDSRTQAFSQ